MHEDQHGTFTHAARRRQRPALRVALLAITAVSTAKGKTKILVTGLGSPLPLLRLGDGAVLVGD